ncbi:DUF2207 domain-containing protein [Cytophagales bacterium LB-30]|uniref:DUF2207 domain-containing protein n=1 Tax=Shiella aurantiaca TaxID=3058365 RepID=A0ABT8F0C4_9BACT|nr:DUF2207 domain-containing protein [Shiella aurantiaca]MDN4163890.1 DUF2207 domain-containing protein [Shiella aurantiaca]
MKRLFFIRLMLMVFPWYLEAQEMPEEAYEHILSYDSRIEVQTNGDLWVTETIRVWAGGDKIQRGIYRSYPTVYTSDWGLTTYVDFEVLDVKKDGEQEPYHVENASNGVNVYIGQENKYLSQGIYTYTLSYRTSKQIGFFEEYDELYWNVTGLDWDFSIDTIRATVILPSGAQVIADKISRYAGYEGDTYCDCTTEIVSPQEVRISTQSPLGSYQGLTIAIPFEKGILHEPTEQELVLEALSDNPGYLILVLVLVFFIVVWIQVGVDPRRGTLVPHFYPPKGFGPAHLRYLTTYKFDSKSMSATYVDMAVRGLIRIKKNGSTFSMERVKEIATERITPADQRILDQLFSRGNTLEMKQANHSELGGAQKALANIVKEAMDDVYLKKNTKYLIWGVVVFLAGYLYTLFMSPAGIRGDLIFAILWFMPWTGACVLLLSRFLMFLREGSVAGSIAMHLFLIPFLGADIFVGFFSGLVPIDSSIYLFVGSIICASFSFLLKAPTHEGRKLLDETEGFMKYLKAADSPAITRMNAAPSPTPALYEQYLSYAMALGVENQWTKQFKSVLEKAKAEGNYRSPEWYNGTGSFSGSSFSSGFSSSISSSSTAPGSSSGSSGGGSSGGGGGGGGGGGW